MRPATAFLLLALLTGCTTRYDLSGTEWTKPGTIFQEITQDEMDCARGAREAGWTPDLVVGGLVDVARVAVEERQRSGSYERCMSAKGYQPS